MCLCALVVAVVGRTCADDWNRRYDKYEGPPERLLITIAEEEDVLPLHDAAKDGNLVRIRKYANAETINARDHFGLTALRWAIIEARRSEPVKLLLELGANPNMECCEGSIALHDAANVGAPELIELLALYGGDVNRQTDASDMSRTPLMMALSHARSHVVSSEPLSGDHFGAARKLVELGANVSILNAGGVTALFYAEIVNEEMVLLIKGARVR
jgi:ankyrin repeat protein